MCPVSLFVFRWPITNVLKTNGWQNQIVSALVIKVFVMQGYGIKTRVGEVKAMSEVTRSADAPGRSYAFGWPTMNVLVTFPSGPRDN